MRLGSVACVDLQYSITDVANRAEFLSLVYPPLRLSLSATDNGALWGSRVGVCEHFTPSTPQPSPSHACGSRRRTSRGHPPEHDVVLCKVELLVEPALGHVLLAVIPTRGASRTSPARDLWGAPGRVPAEHHEMSSAMLCAGEKPSSRLAL